MVKSDKKIFVHASKNWFQLRNFCLRLSGGDYFLGGIEQDVDGAAQRKVEFWGVEVGQVEDGLKVLWKGCAY